MDLSYIKKIIRLVEHSEVDEVEIEEEGKKIKVVKNRLMPTASYQIPFSPTVPQYHPMQAAPHLPAQGPGPAAPEPGAKAKAEPKYHEIRSPIVGTFYRAPSPDADPYVEPGQTVKPGDVLCIVEAMKLMNEIESDIAGKVVKILVDNAKPVEYNQVLFLIEPA
ncbi:MAG: acetyl-CoA carboxylase biotin carboxyl carrier protein [Ignavibacteriales bacterium]|nr:acetyl-CoA carboxylase biotin carboxyl carrier protein [Ignavibacteriales bacterium]